jgi:hypothetical protein
MAAMVDHRTGEQKIWTMVLGIVLLLGGVALAGIAYGNTPWTVAGGVVAVIGLGLLRYALLRRIRARRR